MVAAIRQADRPGKRARTKAANRQAILEAARQVFARLGADAATVRDIIRETDLAAGTFYNYFKSKEEVFEALADEGVVRNLARAPWPYVEQNARDWCAQPPAPAAVRFLVTLAATGEVTVNPERSLSGRVRVDMTRGAGGQVVGVPLAVGGTLDEPSVTLTRAALLGAAIGTVIAPGVGTGAGANLGDRLGEGLKDLFGK